MLQRAKLSSTPLEEAVLRNLITNINWRVRKNLIYIVLVATFILLAVMPGMPLIEEPLYGQQREPVTFRFSFAPILQSPSQPEVRLAKGKFLVASRQLRDPNFSETVVLLIEYNRSGAMGLVINRPTKVKLSTVLPDLEGLQDLQDTVYVGGPVAKNQMLLLIRSGSQPEDASHVFKDIYVSSSRAVLRTMINDEDPGKAFRLYAGHAGWSPGQLDREIARGGWHVLQADEASVFEKAPSEIWPELIHRSSALWVMLMEP